MKNIFYWLFTIVGVLIASSCEQSELDESIELNTKQIQTRAETESIADFDPIDQLSGISVNILNVGNTKYKYLSGKKSGSDVVLYTHDDGSGRQQWRIERKVGIGIFLERGNSLITSNQLAMLQPNPFPFPYPTTGADRPTTVKLIPQRATDQFILGSLNVQPLADGMCYLASFYGKSFNEIPIFLRSQSSTSSTMTFDENNSTNLSKWQIVPIGEYELVGLEYVRTSIDSFTPKEVVCDHDEYTNRTSSVNTWNYSITTSCTETSNFSKTEGISVSASQGINVGLPNVLGGNSSIGLNMSIQQQSTRSWTFGTSGTQTTTKTRSGQIPVQPGETVKLDAILVMYEGSVTYVATLRKIGDTKTFKVKGKWTGSCFSSFIARTYNGSTGKMLNEYTLRE